MTPNEILDDLANCTGTESYHRLSPLMPNVICTDGAMRMAQLCGAFWLLDSIGSHLPSVPKDEGFVVVVFEKQGDGWMLRLVDDIPSSQVYATQKIEYSDFPLDEIKMYAGREDKMWVIFMPSEY